MKKINTFNGKLFENIILVVSCSFFCVCYSGFLNRVTLLIKRAITFSDDKQFLP
jgi:hypothetical protein